MNPNRLSSHRRSKTGQARIAKLALAIYSAQITAASLCQGAAVAVSTPPSAVPKTSALSAAAAHFGFEYKGSLPVAGTSQTVSEYRMKSNGLTVLLSERHAMPIVSVMMLYHVGSRNEAVGYTGATHFLEHMMFKGTQRHDPDQGTGVDDVLKPAGGYNNATTSFDRTNYYEIVPAKDIDICLDIESDRMRNLLLRQRDHDSEMTVVRNELERGEDEAQDLLMRNIFATAFQEHPYHHPIIGWRSDVENMPVSRLKQFYDQFYWPNNATLIVIGDINPAQVLQDVAKRFGKIPRSPKPFPNVYTQEPRQEGERRFTVKRGSELPRVQIAFHTVGASNHDDYALDIIEQILGDETKKSSRLYKAMIDSGIASTADSSNIALKDPGIFELFSSANAQSTPEQVEKGLLAQMHRLKSEPVTAEELERAKKALIKHLKLQLSDPMGMAEQISDAVSAADWKYLNTYPARINSVTAAEVQRVAQKYFVPANMTVGYYMPAKPPESGPGAAGSHVAEQGAEGAKDTAPPPTVAEGAKTATAAGEQTKSASASGPASVESQNAPPAIESREGPAAGTPLGSTAPGARVKPSTAIAGKGSFSARTTRCLLDNGLTVLVMPIKGTGTVAVSGRMRAGQYFSERHGHMLPDILGDMFTAGSAGYSKEALAQKLEEMGTTLTFEDDDFWVGFTSEVTTEDVPNFLPLLADCIQRPKFLPEELEKTKSVKIANLKDDMSDTSSVAWNRFVQSWYKPGTVYFDKRFDQQIDEIKAMTADDLKTYHDRQVSPGNTVLTIVGDIDPDKAIAAVKQSFAGWAPGHVDHVHLTRDIVTSRSAQQTITVQLPDKSNADVYVGHPVPVSVQSPDYFPTLIGNAALGYDSFACRLAPVRDKYGLTYGISSALAGSMFPFAPWTVNFSVNPVNYTRALTLVRKIVDDYIAHGITAEEVAKEKSHLEGAFFVSLRGPKQVASKLCELEMAGPGPKFFDEFGPELRKSTGAQINASIKRYFKLDDAVISAAGTLQNQSAQAPK